MNKSLSPKEGKILIGLPGEPEDLALAIVKDTVNWISANQGIEMTYTQVTNPAGQMMIFLEAMKPDDWNEDKIRTFIGFVGHVALKMRDKHISDYDEGEEWKNA